MGTKRPDMESFREKALSDPAVRKEYEALDAYYKTQRQLIAMRLEFRKTCATIIADPLFDTILEMSASSCPTSDDIARQEHLCKAIRILEKNIQEGLIRRLNQQGIANEDVSDDLCAESNTGRPFSVSHSMAVTEPALRALWDNADDAEYDKL